jgi:hypothetical protein
MRKNGFPKIMGAVKGPKSVEEGIEFLKNYDIVVHPRCIHTIDELSLYSYKQDPLTGKNAASAEDKKNHVIDALRYACEGVRRRLFLRPDLHTNCQLPTNGDLIRTNEDKHGRIPNDQRLANLHAEALSQFDDVQTALRDERLQCLQDRRFYSLAGAQWEGPLWDISTRTSPSSR